MQRVTRHLITVLAALSLLLCLATGVLWERSLVSHEVFMVRGGLDVIRVKSGGGDVALFWETDVSPAVAAMREPPPGEFRHYRSAVQATGIVGSPAPHLRHRTRGIPHDSYDRLHPFAISGGGSASTRERVVVVPHWLLMLAFTLLPAIVVTKRLRARHRRLRAGACPDCGYDLRASPARCPECGRVCKPEPAGASDESAQSPGPL